MPGVLGTGVVMQGVFLGSAHEVVPGSVVVRGVVPGPVVVRGVVPGSEGEKAPATAQLLGDALEVVAACSC